jgi:hypothetical protein
LGAIRTATTVRGDKFPVIIGNSPPVAPANGSPAETALPVKSP